MTQVQAPSEDKKGKGVMRDTVKYKILKSDAANSLLRVEVVEGLEKAANRMEELAASDPSFDYYLYSADVGKVVRRLQCKSVDAESLADIT